MKDTKISPTGNSHEEELAAKDLRIVYLEKVNKQLEEQLRFLANNSTKEKGTDGLEVEAALYMPTLSTLSTESAASPNLRTKEMAISSIPLVGDNNILLMFFCEVMKPRPLLVSLPKCDKSADIITPSDCITLAKAFDYLSKKSTSDKNAINHFLKHYPAMKTLAERNPLLQNLLLLTSVKLAKGRRNYGAFRFIFGASLSSFDTITDIYMIQTYWASGETGFATATIITLLVNLTFQLLIVYMQNRKQTIGRILTEIMYVLTFCKPGVATYRVVMGAEQKVGALLNPKTEMLLVKNSELLAEAIPGAIIQTYAILAGSNQSNAAIFSLIVSVFTAAFTSAGLSFDSDLSKNQRVNNPRFYGYVPSAVKGKVITFVLIFCMATWQLTSKALACALCAIESSNTLVLYLIGDLGLLLLYKVIRRDFRYGAMPVRGMLGLFVAVVFRFGAKTVADFSAVLQARHPYELGGSYFAFTLLSTPAVCFYFGSKYLEYVESDAGRARNLTMVLDSEQVYGLIGGLVGLQALTLICFLRSIESGYSKTFWSPMSGNEHCISRYTNNDDDEDKLDILTHNKHKWERIEEEVLDWVNEKIPEWNEEQPEWWDARRKANIPDWAVRGEVLLKSIRSSEVESI
ncbi:hypothetical protein TrLO_g2953 [Triparma laevis f. longispina]|uniref:Uncharacterized protein n=2 Tax=Triparma laevis f. longispina TaxID=1714387 RepID=A0A9W7KUU0_9STRA|nr:hypothetical protein TrLO_g2953 [Triparma laevis f. longispina]